MNELTVFFIFFLVLAFFIVYPLRQEKILAFFMAALCSLLIFLAYWHWGAWSMWQAHLIDQKKQVEIQKLLHQIQGMPDLINRLKINIKKNPQKAEPYYLLGRLYSSQESWKDAYEAFNMALKLEPKNEKFRINLLLTSWELNHEFKTNDLVSLHEIIATDPHQLDALSMLAMNAYTLNQFKEAIDYWQKILDDLEPNSPEALVVSKAIAKAQAKLNP